MANLLGCTHVGFFVSLAGSDAQRDAWSRIQHLLASARVVSQEDGFYIALRLPTPGMAWEIAWQIYGRLSVEVEPLFEVNQPVEPTGVQADIARRLIHAPEGGGRGVRVVRLDGASAQAMADLRRVFSSRMGRSRREPGIVDRSGGLYGVAPDATVHSLSLSAQDVRGPFSVVEALRSVGDAQVLSLGLMSLPSALLRQALRRLAEQGVIIIANATSTLDFPSWPAAWPEVVGVGIGATGPGRPAGMEVYAPAIEDTSGKTSPGASAALVAGAAALWLARWGVKELQERYPGERLSQAFQEVLRQSCGGKLLNVQAVLAAPLPDVLPSRAPSPRADVEALLQVLTRGVIPRWLERLPIQRDGLWQELLFHLVSNADVQDAVVRQIESGVPPAAHPAFSVTLQRAFGGRVPADPPDSGRPSVETDVEPDVEPDADAATSLTTVAPAVRWQGYVAPPIRDARDDAERTLNELDLSFFQDGLRTLQAVGHVGGRAVRGVAVLVGQGLLLTTHHVLPDEKSARGARFVPAASSGPQPVALGLRPDVRFITNPIGDYTLVAVASVGSDGRHWPSQVALNTAATWRVGDRLAWVKPTHGDPVLSYFRLTVLGVKSSTVMHSMPAEGLEPGTPLFDARWRLVGLHRASFPGPSGASVGEAVRLDAVLRQLQGWRRRTGGWEGGDALKGLVKAAPDDRPERVDRLIKPTGAQRAILRVRRTDWKPPPMLKITVNSQLGRVVSVETDPDTLRKLSGDPDVVFVEAIRTGWRREGGTWPLQVIKLPAGAGQGGKGALIALIDDGLDPHHPIFLDAEGKSRVEALWVQTDPSGSTPRTVLGFGPNYGSFWGPNDLMNPADGMGPTKRPTDNHGTLVAALAAGRAVVSQWDGGVAPDARIVMISQQIQEGASGEVDSSRLVDAIAFLDAYAAFVQRPMVVNISMGLNGGAHDGSSALEAALEEFTDNGRAPGRAVVKSAGNERAERRHATLRCAAGGTVTWTATPSTRSTDVIEAWFPARYGYQLTLTGPGVNLSVGPWSDAERSFGAVQVRVISDRFHLDNGDCRTLIRLQGTALGGKWSLRFDRVAGPSSGDEKLHLWIEKELEADDLSVAPSTFDAFDPSATLTTPGTALSVICVGAMAENGTVPTTSSAGPTRDGRLRPDLVAPGVDIPAPWGFESGSSFASPLVAGAIALLYSQCESQNLPFPNAAQVRGALIAATGGTQWTAERGFGALDIETFLGLFKTT